MEQVGAGTSSWGPGRGGGGRGGPWAPKKKDKKEKMIKRRKGGKVKKWQQWVRGCSGAGAAKERANKELPNHRSPPNLTPALPFSYSSITLATPLFLEHLFFFGPRDCPGWVLAQRGWRGPPPGPLPEVPGRGRWIRQWAAGGASKGDLGDMVAVDIVCGPQRGARGRCPYL